MFVTLDAPATCSAFFNCRFLILGTDRPLQSNHSIAGDNFYVVGISRQCLVRCERRPDLLRRFAVSLIHLLLVGRRYILVGIAPVGLGVVGGRLLILLWRRSEQGSGQQ